MSLIRTTPFGGTFPKIGRRLLPESGAVIASNIKIQSGEARPLLGSAIVNVPNKTLPAVAIFQGRNSIDEAAWFSWPFDVDVVRSPLNVETESRFYWTGDGTPKYATYDQATAGGLNDYPAGAYDLGIPTPQTKPSVSASGGVGAATTRFYVYTYYSNLGEESAPSPVSDILTGKVDDTWDITGMDEIPINGSTGTASFSSGFTTFTNTSSARHWLRVGDKIVIGGDDVIVSELPSASSYKVPGDYSAETSWARKNDWNTTDMKRRLYRTTGTLGAFQLVDDDVSTTYSDTLLDGAILGDDLITQGWFPPPVNLKCLAVHPSGALIGASKNRIWFSEPFQPHAWPEKYSIATDYDVVGIAVYGTEIGVATKGNPYVISGVDPDSMSPDKRPGVYPCLSKRSVIGIDDGFMYATKHGYVYVGASGVSMFSDQFYTKDEWQKLNPASMIAAPAYGRIYIAYSTSDGAQSMIIMEPGILINADVVASDIYTDVESGELYISDQNGISIWDSPTKQPLVLNWRSKDYVLPAPENMGAAKIDFDLAISEEQSAAILAAIAEAISENNAILALGDDNGFLNANEFNSDYLLSSDFVEVPENPSSNTVTFILRMHDQIVVSRTVSSTLAFRLPAGYKDDVFSFEIISQCTIKEVRIAQTMDELRKA